LRCLKFHLIQRNWLNLLRNQQISYLLERSLQVGFAILQGKNCLAAYRIGGHHYSLGILNWRPPFTLTRLGEVLLVLPKFELTSLIEFLFESQVCGFEVIIVELIWDVVTRLLKHDKNRTNYFYSKLLYVFNQISIKFDLFRVYCLVIFEDFDLFISLTWVLRSKSALVLLPFSFYWLVSFLIMISRFWGFIYFWLITYYSLFSATSLNC